MLLGRVSGLVLSSVTRCSLRMSSFSASTPYAGPPSELVSSRVRLALEAAFGKEVASESDTYIFIAKPEFGDYQCNAAMPLAKKLKLKPQEVAQSLSKALIELESGSDGVISAGEITVSGPGFINMRLTPTVLNQKLLNMHNDASGRLAISPSFPSKKVIVDYSSPNIAKEMHVGHLRSTIIGDSLANVQEFLGHEVLRLNHVGDWGTQFGMLITKLTQDAVSAEARDSVSDLVEFYKKAKKQFDEDPEFQEKSRNEVVKLQGGNADTIKAWQDICELSRVEFRKIYDVLKIKDLEERGESFYNPFLPELVAELEQSGVATVSEGALCIFLPGYTNQDNTPLPLLIRKSDGGFLYATTDLAAVRHRASVEKADRVLYVTDVGQAQHFQMVFDASRKANLAPPSVELRHVPFGLVQGEDGKKFKTRAGDTVKLKDLLDEAVRTAEEVMLAEAQGEEAVTELSAEQKAAAKVVGIGAVKYADLSMNRESNYRFRCVLLFSSSSLFSYSPTHSPQLQEDARAAGQHGPVHAVRVCAHPGHSPQGPRPRRGARLYGAHRGRP